MQNELKASLLFNKANEFAFKKDYTKAINHYLESIRLSPNNYKANYNLALAHQKIGKSKESCYLLQQGQVHRPYPSFSARKPW